jgi:glycosyltransferase involved in cell wall biosynthesis
MHVLLIHQAFAGPDDPGGTRHYELAAGLVARGHRVTVITSAITYMTGEARAAEAPLPDGLRVIRVAATQNHHRSYLARGSALFAFAGAALRAAVRVKEVNVVWATSPPLVQVLPAFLASLRARAAFVFEERDLWPEFAIGMGVVQDGVLARAALRFKHLMYRRARAIVINSPGFAPFLAGYGVPMEKVHVIPNGVDVTQFDPEARGQESRSAWGANERFVVLYAGALGPANGLEVVLDAAEELRGTPALFVLIGDGKARAELVAAARRRGLDNVRFEAPQPKRTMPMVMAAADACLATLRDIPLFRTTYPNKVFDYMAAGRAVLLGIDGAIREVVDDARAGIFVRPGDGDALAHAVRFLMRAPEEARAMGERGHAVVCKRFARQVHGRQLDTLLRGLVSSRPSIASLGQIEQQPYGDDESAEKTAAPVLIG